MDADSLAVSLREHLEAIVNGLEARVDQRFKDADSRYVQRFEAQASAVKTAMDASEKAITAAMIASEKAVLKAENAADKRFEGVNEFREMLNGMVVNLLPRREAEERFKAQAEKLDQALARLDKTEGSGAGLRSGWGALVGTIGAAGVLVAIFLGLRGPPQIVERLVPLPAPVERGQ